jgi:hypothetical protein
VVIVYSIEVNIFVVTIVDTTGTRISPIHAIASRAVIKSPTMGHFLASHTLFEIDISTGLVDAEGYMTIKKMIGGSIRKKTTTTTKTRGVINMEGVACMRTIRVIK